MTKYEEFLNKLNIISEEDFNNILSILPDNVDINAADFEIDFLQSKNEIARALIQTILNDYRFCWIDDINLDKREISLEDIDSLEDLYDVEKRLKDWTIINRSEIIEYFEESIKCEENKYKTKLLLSIVDDISIEDIKNFINDYKK